MFKVILYFKCSWSRCIVGERTHLFFDEQFEAHVIQALVEILGHLLMPLPA